MALISVAGGQAPHHRRQHPGHPILTRTSTSTTAVRTPVRSTSTTASSTPVRTVINTRTTPTRSASSTSSTSVLTRAAAAQASSTASSTTSTTRATAKTSAKSTPTASTSGKGVKASGSASTPTATSVPEALTDSTRAVITAVSVIGAVAILAAIAFFLRRHLIKRRQAKTSAWRTSVRKSYTDEVSVKADNPQMRPLLNEKPLVPLPSQMLSPPPPAGIPEYNHRPTSVSSAAPSSIAPSALLLSPVIVPQSPGLGAMNAIVGGGLPASPATPTIPGRELCIVRRTFMPTLPDELSVTTGERVTLVQAFDDGWASCVNFRGERGVVPVECLQRMGDAAQTEDDVHSQEGGAWRLSQRASSIYGAVAAPGTY